MMTREEIAAIDKECEEYMIEIFSYGYWVKSSMKKHQIFVCRFTLLFDGNMRLMYAEGPLAGFKTQRKWAFFF